MIMLDCLAASDSDADRISLQRASTGQHVVDAGVVIK